MRFEFNRKMEQSEAEHRFLKLPELIERLISLLNPFTTLRLLQSGVVDKETLQKSLSLKAWTKLVRKSSYIHLDNVSHLVKILKLLKLEEPSTFLLPLLDQICKSGPSHPNESEVQVICPCSSEPHLITPEAFLILEEVEGAFGTREQSIKTILTCNTLFRGERYNPSVFGIAFSEAFLSATCSRLSRQREIVNRVPLIVALPLILTSLRIISS